MRSGHCKRFSKSKRSKNGGTKRVAGHKRKRLDGSRKMVEKRTARGRGRVDEDVVARLRAPVKRLQTPNRAAPAELEAEVLRAQALATGDLELEEDEVESEAVEAGEGRDVVTSPRQHDMAIAVLTLRSIGLKETWYRIGTPSGA